ncbi:MAG: hypothetical protein VX938_02450, partial [Myxococcota bacterium]|nr:hypothetical protein [Myxococcota bacterium]
MNTPNSDVCDDGDLCTTDDVCLEAVCAGVQDTCDDDFPCTWDLCDYEEGCVNELIQGSCDDGDPCTVNEACEEDALCDGGEPVDVDDGVDCTLDACVSDVGITHTPEDAACSVGQVCDVEVGCSFGDVRLLITKFSLLPTSEDTADGFGQWFSVTNIGEIPVDLRDLEVSNGTDQSVGVLAYSKDPEEVVLLEPGQTRAGHKDAEPGQGPFNTAGFSFVYGEPGDGFKFASDGGAIILRLGGVANDTLDASLVSAGPALAGNAMPLIPGVAAELDVASLGQATDHTDNDIPSQWCAWAEGSSGPEGPQLECSRARLNEIALAGADGERFVEIHMPAGGSLNG